MYYLVSYDLVQPGQQYPRIIDPIKRLGGKKVLESTWTIYSTMPVDQLWRYLANFVDANDRLLVVGINGWWGSSNLLAQPAAA